MRDQPAAVTSAQILSQRLNLSDPAERAAVVKALKESSQMRRKAAEEKAKQMGIPIRGDTAGGGSFELQDFDEQGKPVYHQTRNVNAAISTGADLVRSTAPYSVDGTGMTVGLWDGGVVRATHAEFGAVGGGSRIRLQSDVTGATTFSQHATHVAGTLAAAGDMVSDDENGFAVDVKGMVPGAWVDDYDSADDIAEMTDAAASVAGEAGKINLSNHSYGLNPGWSYDAVNSMYVWNWGVSADGNGANDVDPRFGQYLANAAAVDGIAYNAPYYLPFFAAGNDRAEGPPATGGTWRLWSDLPTTTYTYVPARDPPGDGAYKSGYDTISDSTGKNMMTVGAVTDAVAAGTRSLSAASMTTFSGWGPTDDGRIKPDIVANGDALRSTSHEHDTASAVLSGTSMATPNACGSAALLQQLFITRTGAPMRASTLKGLIIHTADDLGNTGPDYTYGWGLMNTKAAADLILAHVDTMNGGALIEGQQASGDSITYKFYWDGTKPLRVTLSWTDPPQTTPDTAHDDRTPDLNHDLNLAVTGPAGATYLPYVMPYVGNWTQAMLSANATNGINHTDNVEQVYLAAPLLAGVYTITVSNDGLTYQNSTQDFSLIINGNEPPPDIAVNEESQNLQDGERRTFGCVHTGESRSKPFTISNYDDDATLTGLVITKDGDNAADFTITPPAVNTLAPFESTTFSVSFSPGGNGLRKAVIHIASNDPDEDPFDIELTGITPVPGQVAEGTVIPAWRDVFVSNGIYINPALLDSDGNLIVVGSKIHPGEAQNGNDASHCYVAKVSVDTGSVLWERDIAVAGADWSELGHAVMDGNGDLIVLGTRVTFFVENGDRPYLAKIRGSDGVIMWEKTLFGELEQGGMPKSLGLAQKTRPLGIDGSGNLLLTVVRISGISGGEGFNPPWNIYTAKFAAANGDVMWEHTYNGPATVSLDEPIGLVVDGSGDVIVGGESFLVSPPNPQVTKDTVVLRLAAGDGHELWSYHTQFSEPGYIGYQSTGAPVVDSTGAVILVTGSPYYGFPMWATPSVPSSLLRVRDGVFYWSRQFYGNAIMSMAKVFSNDDVLLVSPTGLVERLRHYGNTPAWRQELPLELVDAVIDASGNVVVVGWTLDDNPEYLTVRLDETDGHILWAGCYDSVPTTDNPFPWDTPEAMFLTATGNIVVVGNPALVNYNLANNTPPVVARNNATVTVDEGQTATNTGTFSDADGNATVALRAARFDQPYGVITPNAAAGTWSWSLNTTAGPEESGTVSIIADDAIAPNVIATFALTVNDVAPTFDPGPNVVLTRTQAAAFSRPITFVDPGDDYWEGFVNYHDDLVSTGFPLTINRTTKSFTLGHAFAFAGIFPVQVALKQTNATSFFERTFTVTVQRSLSDWRMDNFGTTDNTGAAASTADVDHDGIPNLAEFAFNLKPHQSDAVMLPQPGFMGGGNFTSPRFASGNLSPSGGDSFGFSFAEPPATIGITYGAEYSSNLTDWLPVTDTGSDGTHTFSVPVGSNTRLFIRLVITEQP